MLKVSLYRPSAKKTVSFSVFFKLILGNSVSCLKCAVLLSMDLTQPLRSLTEKTNTSESRILMMPAESSGFLIFRPLIFALMVCRNIYSQAEILSLHELVQVSEKPTFTGKTTALCTLQVSLFGQKSIRTMMQNLFFKAPFRQAMRSIFVLPRSDLDSRV